MLHCVLLAQFAGCLFLVGNLVLSYARCVCAVFSIKIHSILPSSLEVLLFKNAFISFSFRFASSSPLYVIIDTKQWVCKKAALTDEAN